jgi:hypothetical protein
MVRYREYENTPSDENLLQGEEVANETSRLKLGALSQGLGKPLSEHANQRKYCLSAHETPISAPTCISSHIIFFAVSYAFSYQPERSTSPTLGLCRHRSARRSFEAPCPLTGRPNKHSRY